jgi:hypothetical protein
MHTFPILLTHHASKRPHQPPAFRQASSRQRHGPHLQLGLEKWTRRITGRANRHRGQRQTGWCCAEVKETPFSAAKQVLTFRLRCSSARKAIHSASLRPSHFSSVAPRSSKLHLRAGPLSHLIPSRPAIHEHQHRDEIATSDRNRHRPRPHPSLLDSRAYRAVQSLLIASGSSGTVSVL